MQVYSPLQRKGEEWAQPIQKCLGLGGSKYLTVGQSEEGEEDDYNNAVAVAHALRAWAHFELLTYFSPDLTDNSAPGVIILDFIPNANDEVARSTTGEVFAKAFLKTSIGFIRIIISYNKLQLQTLQKHLIVLHKQLNHMLR